jgi:hypothetical protein
MMRIFRAGSPKTTPTPRPLLTIGEDALTAVLDDLNFDTEPTPHEWWQLQQFTDDPTRVLSDAIDSDAFAIDSQMWPDITFGINGLDSCAYMTAWVRLRPTWPVLQTDPAHASAWFAGNSQREMAENAVRCLAGSLNQLLQDAQRMAPTSLRSCSDARQWNGSAR